MAASTQIAKIAGIPIRVHITLWILLPLFAINLSHGMGLIWGLVAALGLFTSVALHELGHSLVAIRKGCGVREILLLPIGGMAKMEQIPTIPRDEIQMALAGPAVSILLSIVFGIIGQTIAGLGLRQFGFMLQVLGQINLFLGLFNLLPSFPMDGGRVFRAFMSARVGRLEATRIAAKIGKIMAIGFGIIGILLPGGITLIAIAIFIYFAADAEYRMMRMQQGARAPQTIFTQGRPSQQVWTGGDDIEVSPPPYARKKQGPGPRKRARSIFDDLYDNWHGC